MADFAGYEEWSLQAIVRGSAKNFTTHVMDTNDHHHRHDFLFAFSDLLDEDHHHRHTPNKVLLDNGLETLYKPFYPVSDREVKDEAEEVVGEKQKSEELVLQEKKIPLDSSAETAYVPKYKRRKNQQKIVVMQVTAEGLSSDKWAWRKYGQKPIKGSPYPRSYYRCSSMKGCLARKQVEQSGSDPTIFILTYTGKHCHSQPTRRNSLAGTVRTKFTTPTPKSHNNQHHLSETSKILISSKPSLMASANQEEVSVETTKVVKQEIIQEDHREEQRTDQWGCFNNISDEFLMMDDEDLFSRLENLNGSDFRVTIGHGYNV